MNVETDLSCRAYSNWLFPLKSAIQKYLERQGAVGFQQVSTGTCLEKAKPLEAYQCHPVPSTFPKHRPEVGGKKAKTTLPRKSHSYSSQGTNSSLLSEVYELQGWEAYSWAQFVSAGIATGQHFASTACPKLREMSLWQGSCGRPGARGPGRRHLSVAATAIHLHTSKLWLSRTKVFH